MPSSWVEATTGYAAAWPLGERATRAESSRRKSTSSSASTSHAGGGGGVEGDLRLVEGADHPDALAVVAAAGGLEDARQAEGLDLGGRGDDGVAGARHVELGEPATHHGLVLGVDERARPGSYGDPVGLERVQVRGRHVLVVERDHARALGDPAQRRQVGVVTDELVGDHLGGGDALGLGQQAQRQPQRDRGLGHHPGQLAAPDDGERGARWEPVEDTPGAYRRPRQRSRRPAQRGDRGCAVSKRRPRPRWVVIRVGRRGSSSSLRRSQPRWTSMVLELV